MARSDRDREDTAPKGKRPSLDDDDAIDVGLFSSGPARIQESIFTTYDYGGSVTRNPPIVWLVTYSRGEGKEKEQYEQPYTIGKGWTLSKKTGEIAGQDGLPKTCNAIVHLIKPLKKALLKAGIDASVLSAGNPQILEGLECEVERVEQEVRVIRRDAREARERGQDVDRGPKTILEIRVVESAPWEKGGGKAKGRAKDEDDDEAKPARGSKASGRGKAEAEDEDKDETEPSDSVTDDAIEALVAVVEKGKVKKGEDLEEALEKYLKGVKGAGDIIDLATSEKFLKTEKGWTNSAKYIDAAE